MSDDFNYKFKNKIHFEQLYSFNIDYFLRLYDTHNRKQALDGSKDWELDFIKFKCKQNE